MQTQYAVLHRAFEEFGEWESSEVGQMLSGRFGLLGFCVGI